MPDPGGTNSLETFVDIPGHRGTLDQISVPEVRTNLARKRRGNSMSTSTLAIPASSAVTLTAKIVIVKLSVTFTGGFNLLIRNVHVYSTLRKLAPIQALIYQSQKVFLCSISWISGSTVLYMCKTELEFTEIGPYYKLASHN